MCRGIPKETEARRQCVEAPSVRVVWRLVNPFPRLAPLPRRSIKRDPLCANHWNILESMGRRGLVGHWPFVRFASLLPEKQGGCREYDWAHNHARHALRFFICLQPSVGALRGGFWFLAAYRDYAASRFPVQPNLCHFSIATEFECKRLAPHP